MPLRRRSCRSDQIAHPWKSALCAKYADLDRFPHLYSFIRASIYFLVRTISLRRIYPIQSSLNDLNMLGILKICLRYGLFEPLRVNHNARSESKWRLFRESFSIFCTIFVCWVYSLESPRWGASNEYAQHTISWQKKRKFPSVFVFLSHWKNFVGTQKRNRINQGKRAIGVRAIEIRLYI